MSISRRSAAAGAICGLVAASLLVPHAREQTSSAAQMIPRGPDVRLVPEDLDDPSWLHRFREAQIKALGGVAAFHDFRFTDRLEESGITFRHRIVDDAGKAYNAAHYDHGNGLAMADVDGDGRTDLYFVNQVGGNQLWRNVGGGRFEEITGPAGVALADRVNVSASFADIDNDGDADLYVTSVRGGNVMFENDGRARFKDITAASGLRYAGHSSGALFFDYNRDGRLDLMLVNVGRFTTGRVAGEGYKYYVAFEDAFAGHLKPERAERSILYRNDGGKRFVDASRRTGVLDFSWTGDASAVDGNDDGWPDLYLVNMQGDDQSSGATLFF